MHVKFPFCACIVATFLIEVENTVFVGLELDPAWSTIARAAPRLCTPAESGFQIHVHHDCPSALAVFLPHTRPISHARRIHEHSFPSPHTSRTSSPPPRRQIGSDSSPHQPDKQGPPRTHPGVRVRGGTHGLKRGLNVIPSHALDAPRGMDVPKHV